MGTAISKEHCYDLRDLPRDSLDKITHETYTVLRSNGKEDYGWLISVQKSCEKGVCQGYKGWEDAHASDYYVDSKGIKGMKFFMTTGWKTDKGIFYSAFSTADAQVYPDRYFQGWRANYKGRRTFWPTRLNEQEREEWFEWLDAQIATLKTPAQVSGKCSCECKTNNIQ